MTDELTAAVARLREQSELVGVGDLVSTVLARRTDLRTVLAALEAAQADAARYRWLRRDDTEYPCAELPDGSGYRYFAGAELDAAIDAAMKGEGDA